MSDSDDDGVLGDVGFMFDAHADRVTQEFKFGTDISVQLAVIEQDPGALQSGHYVWPAAPAMCNHLCSIHSQMSEPTNIVEVGAGCGLVGLVAAQLWSTAHVIFTDHDPGVLQLIDDNIASQTKSQAKCSTLRLPWGETGRNEMKELEALQGATQSTELILGSDVIYAQEIVPLLFWSIHKLLRQGSNPGVFIMSSSFSYDEATEKEIDTQCQLYYLQRHIIQDELDTGGVRLQTFTPSQ